MNNSVAVLVTFVKYLWPKEKALKVRVVTALGLLMTAKVSFFLQLLHFYSDQILNVQVPFLFKNVVDSLNLVGPEAVVAVPIALLISCM